MPLLRFVSKVTCPTCAFRLPGVMVGTFRINKGSLKAPRGTLSFIQTPCPECRTRIGRPDADRWQLDPESQAVVDAFRERKGWPAIAADST